MGGPLILFGFPVPEDLADPQGWLTEQRGVTGVGVHIAGSGSRPPAGTPWFLGFPLVVLGSDPYHQFSFDDLTGIGHPEVDPKKAATCRAAGLLGQTHALGFYLLG